MNEGDGAPAVSPRSRLARGLMGLTIALVVLGLATVRVVLSGEAEIAASDDALRAGDPHEAVVRARRAAQWYAPGAAHVSVAYARLIALARASEERKRFDIALLAWRGVRSAALTTRWLLTPHAADLAMADKEIARLMALEAGSPDERARIEQEELLRLTVRTHPSSRWTAALVVGFVMAATGAGLAARRGAAPGGRFRFSQARWPFAVMLVGITLWLLAVWRA